MKILGIDQSFSCTGICLKDGDDHVFSTISTQPNKEDPLEKFKRAMDISETIVNLILDASVAEVNIEGLALGRAIGNSNRDLAILQGIIVSDIMKKCNIEPNIIAPTSLKKFATGKGNSPKDMLFECLPDDVKEYLLTKPKSKGRLDLCDAYWLANFKQ
jgi:Holliday junction resolvasome RuvABC endonuclease subunit